MRYFAALWLLAATLLGLEAANGTTALIEFAKIPPDASLRFEARDVALLRHPTQKDRYFALIAIDYRSALGEKALHVSYSGGTKTIALKIIEGNYTKETLSVAQEKVTPSKAERERTEREYAEAMAIYRTFNPKRHYSKPFTLPLQSPITSPFGTARIYNGSLSGFHGGTDFRAPVGTPVYASNDGVVVLAKDRFYAGQSVVIDHGEGIYSTYYHLSRLHVKAGETVKQGQAVGLSGASGRVSGPHLHYGIMLQGLSVDPLQFHAQIDRLFSKGER
ncbi:MAG: M23 family metallopeptidase [Campylobacterales bacterium]|nr:M23 family metallopeptidase [Campylobacterales bacterium]